MRKKSDNFFLSPLFSLNEILIHILSSFSEDFYIYSLAITNIFNDESNVKKQELSFFLQKKNKTYLGIPIKLANNR